MNVHRVWRLKQQIQDSEIIGIDRDLCGLPVFKVPKAVLEQADEVNEDGSPTEEALAAKAIVQDAIKAVSDLRFNRSGGLVIPSDTFAQDVEGDRALQYDFKLVTSAGQRSIDTRTAARDYDRAIARVLMMQFLHLGDRSTGSFALSADQSDIGVRAISTIAKKIAIEFNRKAVPLIWMMNALDPRYMPRLRVSDLNKDGIVQIGKFLNDVAGAADLWAADPVARRSILNSANIPFDPTAQAAAAERFVETQNTPAPTFGRLPGPTDGAEP
jgi:hypothetical protein